jgi:anti-sigma regulatory factor (Ser/Thr protein kinase)
MDEFTIHIPRERPFSAVADLVVGGIAARHDVTLDVLDDVQLALDSLLEHDEADDSEVGIVLRVAGDAIEATVGPLTRKTAAALEEEAGEGLGLRRLLETTMDSFTLSERDGGSWVELRKGYALAGTEK